VGMQRRTAFILLVSLLSVCLIGCETKTKQVEQPIAQTTTTANAPATPETPVPKLSPPTAATVRAALQRVFGDAVRLDESTAPAFLAGDFNSDQSEDLMVLVRPNPQRVANLNSELANWTIQEPRHTWLPPAGQKVVKLPPVSEMREQVRAAEPLIAVIHGFGPQGWRSDDARQAFLLRDVTGQVEGAFHMEHLPRQFAAGDVVRERLGTEHGFLYWFSGKYVWQTGSPAQLAQEKPGNRG
jgi:hypothetical protein